MTEPFLSIVIVGRNDNYGGDFTNRFQNCIDWNTKWLEQHEVSTEVVFVNWNPVLEETQIQQQINWPSDRKHVRYRIITVPQEVHQQFVDPEVRDTVPLFEFIAKNVGIRRATGKYILCINADVLIHPDIIGFIAQRTLEDGTYYRADRWDYTNPSSVEVEELYNAGFAVFMKARQYKFPPFLEKKKWYRFLQRYNAIHIDWNLFKYRHRKIFRLLFITIFYNNGGYLAHCMASGDFMLMARKNWLDLKGYLEYTPISTHTDSVMSILAFERLSEFVFEVPVFHQAHERRYGWKDISNNPKFHKAYEFFEHVANRIKSGEPTTDLLNKDDWGLKGVELKEQII